MKLKEYAGRFKEYIIANRQSISAAAVMVFMIVLIIAVSYLRPQNEVISAANVSPADVPCVDGVSESDLGGGDSEYEGQLAVPAYVSMDRPAIASGVYPPLKSARVTSAFGYRKNPVSGNFKFHSGYDLAAPSGSPIYAMYDGTVSVSKWDDGYGNYIIIDHTDGQQTLYAHCSELLAGKSERVEAGQVIAKVGSTGNSTGPHLHVELRIGGKRYDPEWILGGMYG